MEVEVPDTSNEGFNYWGLRDSVLNPERGYNPTENGDIEVGPRETDMDYVIKASVIVRNHGAIPENFDDGVSKKERSLLTSEALSDLNKSNPDEFREPVIEVLREINSESKRNFKLGDKNYKYYEDEWKRHKINSNEFESLPENWQTAVLDNRVRKNALIAMRGFYSDQTYTLEDVRAILKMCELGSGNHLRNMSETAQDHATQIMQAISNNFEIIATNPPLYAEIKRVIKIIVDHDTEDLEIIGYGDARLEGYLKTIVRFNIENVRHGNADELIYNLNKINATYDRKDESLAQIANQNSSEIRSSPVNRFGALNYDLVSLKYAEIVYKAAIEQARKQQDVKKSGSYDNKWLTTTPEDELVKINEGFNHFFSANARPLLPVLPAVVDDENNSMDVINLNTEPPRKQPTQNEMIDEQFVVGNEPYKFYAQGPTQREIEETIRKAPTYGVNYSANNVLTAQQAMDALSLIIKDSNEIGKKRGITAPVQKFTTTARTTLIKIQDLQGENTDSLEELLVGLSSYEPPGSWIVQNPLIKLQFELSDQIKLYDNPTKDKPRPAKPFASNPAMVNYLTRCLEKFNSNFKGGARRVTRKRRAKHMKRTRKYNKHTKRTQKGNYKNKNNTKNKRRNTRKRR